MPARRILIVEDDPKTSASIDLYLKHEGYRTRIVADGADAVALARSERFDLIVLDVMLPGVNGVDVCRTLRAESNIPIILLTARSTDEDKLRGLDTGADDYVTKPFSPRELMARVRAVLRRSEPAGEPIRVGDLQLDPHTREVKVRDRNVELTAAEFRLLAAFVRMPGRVFTREELLQRAFGEATEAFERTVDVHIKNLRRKIEDDRANPTHIVTVFGVGYRFVPQ